VPADASIDSPRCPKWRSKSRAQTRGDVGAAAVGGGGRGFASRRGGEPAWQAPAGWPNLTPAEERSCPISHRVQSQFASRSSVGFEAFHASAVLVVVNLMGASRQKLSVERLLVWPEPVSGME
jgi:hypothetical protein